MSVVAVAGGTGSIGRTIVEQIVANGELEVIVLGRKVDAELEKALGARIVAADYSNVDAVVALLQDNKVGTVVSALGAMSPLENELNLIKAANQSSVTKRYIPSVWGVRYRPEDSWFPIAQARLAAFDALEKTSLEWTSISNGLFLDYWGIPEIKSYLTPATFVVDVDGKMAAIPGTGNLPVTFTYSGDVAKFTAKLLTVENWQRESRIIGDKLTWNEFAKLAQEVTGEKFKIVYDSIELLESGKITELPSHVPAYPFFPKEALQGMFAQFGRLFESGLFDLQSEKSLNSLFPEIKPISAKEMLEKRWKK